MQHSIIAGMLLLSVSRKSFNRAPSSPIFSLTCFSSQMAKADFFSPGGPTEKCIGASGVGATVTGGIGGGGGAGAGGHWVGGGGAKVGGVFPGARAPGEC